jgi:hypothetical protein
MRRLMMNKRTLVYFVFLGFFGLIVLCSNSRAARDEVLSDLDEEAVIERAVEEQYIRGLEIRDFELIRSICIPEARLMSNGRDGKLHLTTLDKWSKRFDPDNPPFESLESHIIKIDREGTAAQIKILFVVDSKRRVIDYLHMLKLDGKWRIVNIIDY